MSAVDLSPAPLMAGTSPQEVVDQITGAAKSSFSLGMKLLSRPRRQAMRSVYAFCRIVDDIADGDLPTSVKLGLLGDWRAEIEALYTGQPRSAIGHALAGPVAAHDLPEAEFLAMIDGMEMDANGPIVAPSRADLALYTRRVAGSVGQLSMRIFGAWKGAASEHFGLALADALQLTNILRDVEEDADIGRLYLPREMLEKHGVSADPARVAMAPGLRDVCRDLGAEARQNFVTARQGIPGHNRVAIAPALAMLGVYETYLDRMEALDWRRDVPMTMSSAQKLRHGLGAALFARSER